MPKSDTLQPSTSIRKLIALDTRSVRKLTLHPYYLTKSVGSIGVSNLA